MKQKAYNVVFVRFLLLAILILGIGCRPGTPVTTTKIRTEKYYLLIESKKPGKQLFLPLIKEFEYDAHLISRNTSLRLPRGGSLDLVLDTEITNQGINETAIPVISAMPTHGRIPRNGGYFGFEVRPKKPSAFKTEKPEPGMIRGEMFIVEGDSVISITYNGKDNPKLVTDWFMDVVNKYKIENSQS